MKFQMKAIACFLLACATGLRAQKESLNWVNTLVGTAPLDKQELIGNAPPPGEELYTGMTSPGAVLPHGITDLGPINKNLDVSYPAGVGMHYDYLSWYVLSAMGFFPVDPATENYEIGSPVFTDVTIHLGNGKAFEVVANNNSEKNIYIQSATLNGEPLDRPWFTHTEIANGGKLVLNMGSEPNEKWGCAPEAAPPSM